MKQNKQLYQTKILKQNKQLYQTKITLYFFFIIAVSLLFVISNPVMENFERKFTTSPTFMPKRTRCNDWTLPIVATEFSTISLHEHPDPCVIINLSITTVQATASKGDLYSSSWFIETPCHQCECI